MQRLKVPRYIQWIVLTGFIFLLLMSLLRLSLVLSFNHPKHLQGLLAAFVLGLRYDLRIVGIVSLLVFLIGSFKALNPIQKKAGRAISFSLWTLFIIALCFFYAIDFPHYAYLSQRLNGSVLNYLDDAKISMKMVWQTYPVIKIIIGLILGVLALLGIVKLTYNYILSKKITSTRRSGIAWSAVLFVLLAIAIFGRVGQFPLRWSDAFAVGDDYKAQVSLNPFQSFFSSLSYRHATYDLKKVKAFYPLMAATLGVSNPDINKLNFERIIPAVESAGVEPNVVLVICESFSAYKSSMIGNPLNTTPFFNQMVQNGIYFSHCFSPAYGTARGVWATVTGIPDVQLYKTASRNPAAVDQHTIINDFKGYEKYYFLGGSTSWANIRGLLTNNIDSLHLYEEGDYKAAKVDVWGISDKNLFLESNKVLGKERKPFFAVIQTADNHRPYTIPEEDLNNFKKKKVPQDTLVKYGFATLDEYNAFRYTDYCYQQFMEAAKKEKYFNNTIFVFVGDHGIKGVAGDMLPKVFSELSLTSEYVPLLFYAPAFIKPAGYNYPASQVDILPTLAGMCNIGYTNTALGKDLLKEKDTTAKNAFIIDIDERRIGVIQNNLYYSYNLNGSGEQIASILNNEKVIMTDSLRKAYKTVTDAYYETSRYLLLNNKKKKVQ
jgi:phosphoglycerol transferase MdoB-like AlkP superfamily enzyme